MKTIIKDMSFGQYILKNEGSNLPTGEFEVIASCIINPEFKAKKPINLLLIPVVIVI